MSFAITIEVQNNIVILINFYIGFTLHKEI